MQAAGPVAAHLKLSLQKFDGGLQYMDTFIGLSVEQIKAVGQEKGLAAKNLIAFANSETEVD